VGAPPTESQPADFGVLMEDYVTIEVGSVVHSGGTVIGEGTVVGVGSIIGSGAKVGKASLQDAHFCSQGTDQS
jgi:dynactin 6